MAGSFDSTQALLDYTIQVNDHVGFSIQNTLTLWSATSGFFFFRILVFKTALRTKYSLAKFTLKRKRGDPR